MSSTVAAAPPGRLRAGLARVPPWVLAAALAGLVLVLNPRTADLAAQTFRVALYKREGFVIWDNWWYAGHHVPAYSLLSPPLGAWLGVRSSGALGCAVAAFAFDRLLLGLPDRRAARLAGVAFAVAVAAQLVSGRTTFIIGAALAIAAVAALRERRRLLALGLALLTAVGSPVAGAFLALAAAAWWLGTRAPVNERCQAPLIHASGRLRDALRRGVGGRAAGAPGTGTFVAFGAAAVVPAGLLGLLFPEGGDFPFALSSLLPAVVATALILLIVPRELRALRAGVWLYLALLVVSGVVSTPMGGNAARFGSLLAGPLCVLALAPARRWRLLLALVPLFTYWAWSAAVNDWVQSAHDPTITSPAYSGLRDFFGRQRTLPYRVEVPFTDNHWEASKLAPGVALARGWERQYDRKVNALFYDGKPLTPQRYRTWLDANAVRFVALAKAPVDYSAAREAALVRSGLPYLRPVYADRVWRVWENTDPAPMGVTALSDDGFSTAPGEHLVRVRWTPYFAVTSGHGCVSRAGAWTRVRADGGPLTVHARLSLAGALRRTRACG